MNMDINAMIREDALLLQPLEQPTTAGRCLNAVGFVLGDSFDTILKQISEEYLSAAWTRLSDVLERENIRCDDLSWGWLHEGETSPPNTDVVRKTSKPSDYIGWTSCDLADSWPIRHFEYLDSELKSGVPSLRCLETWRSLKWSIAPQDFSLALRLIEYFCTEDLPSWIPKYLLGNVEQPRELWHRIALSFATDNQQELNVFIEEARQSYTPLGFRILLRGFGFYLSSGAYEGKLTLPVSM